MNVNPYNVLGVDTTASQADIKKAYRKLAHQYHPDKGQGDEEKFKEVNAAYQILSDDAKRAQYDQFGGNVEGAGAPGAGFNVNWDDLGGMGDIFEQFFGGRTQPFGGEHTREVKRGDDIAIDVTISFSESATGISRDMTHRLYQVCDICRGNGAEPGTPITSCGSCQGSGTQTREHRTLLGVMQSRVTCSTCHGEGTVAETKCSTCRGEGRTMRQRTLEVAIPAGINDGQTIRLSGQGEVPAYGGQAGDLFVRVHVTADERLVRDGDNVRTTVAIPFADAALGATVRIQTLSGEEALEIPAGTQPGTEITLDRQGFPRLQGTGSGDHIVTVEVEVPTKVSRKQRKLLEEFQTTDKKGIFS